MAKQHRTECARQNDETKLTPRISGVARFCRIKYITPNHIRWLQTASRNYVLYFNKFSAVFSGNAMCRYLSCGIFLSQIRNLVHDQRRRIQHVRTGRKALQQPPADVKRPDSGMSSLPISPTP